MPGARGNPGVRSHVREPARLAERAQLFEENAVALLNGCRRAKVLTKPASIRANCGRTVTVSSTVIVTAVLRALRLCRKPLAVVAHQCSACTGLLRLRSGVGSSASAIKSCRQWRRAQPARLAFVLLHRTVRLTFRFRPTDSKAELSSHNDFPHAPRRSGAQRDGDKRASSLWQHNLPGHARHYGLQGPRGLGVVFASAASRSSCANVCRVTDAFWQATA